MRGNDNIAIIIRCLPEVPSEVAWWVQDKLRLWLQTARDTVVGLPQVLIVNLPKAAGETYFGVQSPT
jgi:hypothetical protein